MDKCINFNEFLRNVFDEAKLVEKGATIVKAILEAQSPRLTNIAEKMVGKSESCYKVIQRFLSQTDLKKVLLRFYQEEAEFVIGDPTEMPRHKAVLATCLIHQTLWDFSRVEGEHYCHSLPLRTVRESFPSHGSSLSYRYLWKRGFP